MRRHGRIAGRLAGLGLAAALLWTVAPALSFDRYAPQPVNFEQPIPELVKLDVRESRRAPAALSPTAGEKPGLDEGRVRYLSEPIPAPARFDLVGLPDQRGEVELRTRPEDGEWSPWVPTNAREPAWAGGAHEVQLRSRDRPPRGELAYVNVSGDATGADRVANGLRGALNSALVSVASVVAPREAAAEPPFEVVNRAEWDPRGSCEPRTPVDGEVRAAVVHHTVNANTYTPDEAPGIVLAICRYHRYSQGWNDIGYNALVDRFGNVYAGRAGGLSRPVVGAHTAGFNSQTVGVASIGTHTTIGMTKAAIGAVVRFLAWKLPLHGVDAAGKASLVSGGGSGNRYPRGSDVRLPEVTRHRRLNETACPGRAQISKVLKRTARRIAAGGDPSAPPDGGVPG